MNNPKPCKNCDNLARKNIELEIKIKELESKLSYYENPNSPPSADSLHWKKQKKEKQRTIQNQDKSQVTKAQHMTSSQLRQLIILQKNAQNVAVQT